MLGTKTMKISMHLGWKKGSSDQFPCLCEVSIAGTAMNLGGRALTPNISNLAGLLVPLRSRTPSAVLNINGDSNALLYLLHKRGADDRLALVSCAMCCVQPDRDD